ncbi:flagellar filament capping protein FliD [Geodermatophilus sp. CPCC 206100]|uniref:flagellar filament capping protein FliD n=1 Tax=Geodermatophilus sp. CPCC 206100 TaxID=3020054 RepID=UPI003B00CA1C
MSTSVGLISGMDTASLIGQLMQVEANPQTLLKNKLVSTNSDGNGYRAVNLRFDSLRSAAAGLSGDAAWTAAKATSSNAGVTASAGSGALAGSLTFTVEQLATAHSMRSDTVFAAPAGKTAADTDFTATSIDVRVGTTTTKIDLDTDKSGTATLTEAAAAINAKKDLGLTATVVQVAEGRYRMQLSTATSGAAGTFSVTGGPAFSDLTTGVDAKLTIGSGDGAYAVTSPSNTFKDLLPATAITVSKKGETSTVTVARDTDATAAKVQALVDAANNALQVVSDYTSKDSATATLQGDSTLRDLAGRVLDIVSSGVGGKSAAGYGIQLTKDGRLTFDKAAFSVALAADPAATRTFFTATTGAGTTAQPVGLAAQIEAMAKSASDATTGSLTLLAKGSDNVAKDLQERIAGWDVRLALRKETLTRQFTAMETALSALQNQSSWLAGQISGLPSWS